MSFNFQSRRLLPFAVLLLVFACPLLAQITITTPSPLPDGTENGNYFQTLQANGGVSPYNWNVTSGNLPSGLSLDSATGQLSSINNLPAGTAGTYTFTVFVIDVTGLSTTKQFALTVNQAPVITTPSPLNSGTLGFPYTAGVSVQFGTSPYSWSDVESVLPPGLSLDVTTCGGGDFVASTTCLIVGTPTTLGTFNFSIGVDDTNGSFTSQPFAITINPAPTITTTLLPPGTVGVNYSQTVTAIGGTQPLTWSIGPGAGTLPAGLSLNSLTGLISGSPTTAGVSNFNLVVTDTNGGFGAKLLSITIDPALVISTNSPLPSGTVGVNYAQTFVATGGSQQYNWSVTAGTLPAGLSLNSSTGVLNGVPTTLGPANFTVQVADSAGASTTKPFQLTINPVLSITTGSPLPTGAIGVSYAQNLAATGGSGIYTWSVSTGALPGGLALNSTTGSITGVPNTAGTANFTVQVADTNQSTATKAFALTINASLSITTNSPLPSGTVGVRYAQTLTAGGGTPPLLWSLSAGSLPAGLSLNSTTGVISGTPSLAGVANFTIQVSDNNQVTATKPFTLTISGAVSITSTSPLPSGTLNVAYAQTLTAIGGSGTYFWSVNAGTLPAGLSLNSSTGQISGIPTTVGTTSVTIQVADTNDASATKAFLITINGPLTITTGAQLPSGAVGVIYAQTLQATGGTSPYTWSLTQGTLPLGLSLIGATGQLNGTPTVSGTSRFTIQVKDSQGLTTSKLFTLTINLALVITTTSPLPSGIVSVSYSQTMLAAGGATPFTWAITSGALPAGLSLNSSSGLIAGTPTTVGAASFTVQVTDANGAVATAPFTLTISSSLTITNATLPGGSLGTSYSQTITVAGGTAPFTFAVSAGTLPAGLSLNTASGQITGTPTTVGSSTFTIQVTDSKRSTTSKQFSVAIAPVLTITSTSPLPSGTANVTYSTTLLATGGTPLYTWTVTAGALPGGLTLNSATGQISGKPATAATANFTVQVADSNGATASGAFTLTIAGNPAITTVSLPAPGLGSSYSQQLSATGTGAPFTWSIGSGSLPGGLTLSSGGLISGTPTAVGSFTFTVVVTDSSQSTASQPFTLLISPVPATMNIQGLPATAAPQQQLPLTVALSQPYPVDLSGTLTLEFTPNPATPIDDPAIQFNTGGRSVTFQIAAGQTSAVFPQSTLQVQTGTVSGTLTFSLTVTAGGLPVTLTGSNSPVTVSLPAQAPVISSVTIQQTSSGFSVLVTGLSNSREITEADFHFTAQSGSQIQTSDFTPTGVSDAFQTWFASDAASAFGSTFLYTQPFTITTGSVNTLQSVTVTLKNAQGASATATATF